MYCIIEYREHDAETSVNGPYSNVDDALQVRDAMAAAIVDRRVKAGNKAITNETPTEWDDERIVFDPDYEHEPTDDDWHVTLRVDLMGEPWVRCHNCGSIPNIRCCEFGRDR